MPTMTRLLWIASIMMIVTFVYAGYHPKKISGNIGTAESCPQDNADGENFIGSDPICAKAAAVVGGVTYNNGGFDDCEYFHIPAGSCGNEDLQINAVKCYCSNGKILLVQKNGDNYNVYHG